MPTDSKTRQYESIEKFLDVIFHTEITFGVVCDTLKEADRLFDYFIKTVYDYGNVNNVAKVDRSGLNVKFRTGDIVHFHSKVDESWWLTFHGIIVPSDILEHKLNLITLKSKEEKKDV